MPKLLLERSSFQKLLDLFFKAKSEDKADEFVDKLTYTDPELGKAFDTLHKSLIKSALLTKAALEKQGLDTKGIDANLQHLYNL
jgi:hypothetical protein